MIMSTRGGNNMSKSPATKAIIERASRMAPRRVLLTNDDGPASPFFAPFVKHIATSLKWKCVVCLPSREFSFCSKSISKGPIGVEEIRQSTLYCDLEKTFPEHKEKPFLSKIYHIDASPSTCVNIALNSLAADCDLVLSGPNVGHNAGRSNIMSSGTVGAAMEGSIAGCKSVALSFPFFDGWNGWTEQQIEEAVKVSGNVIKHLWESWASLPGEEDVDFYNVNVPLGIAYNQGDDDNQNLQFMRRTFIDKNSDYKSLFARREDTASCNDSIDLEDNCSKFEYVWKPKGVRSFDSLNVEDGSDVWAVKQKLVSVTPLKANLQFPGHKN